MSQTNNSSNANATTPLPTINGGTGVSSPAAHGVLVSEGSSSFNPIVLSAGNLLIGTTAGDPVAANLTAGTGITITSATGSITIANAEAAGGGFIWTDVTTTTGTILAGGGYISDNTLLVTITLPSTSALGDSFCILGKGAGGWKLMQNAGQQINFGNTATTAGTGGSIASTNQYDSISCVCVTAGASSIWATRCSQGMLTVT